MPFSVEQRPSDSPYIERIWRAETESLGTLISQAATRCELVFITYQGKTKIIVRGPETKATRLPVQALGAEFFGITFITGAYMPQIPPKQLVDRKDVNLPEASKQSFWLDCSTWQIPNFENADTFVGKLVHKDILVRDPVVETVLAGRNSELSKRAVQYRFSRATGLPHSTIEQIKRARLAATFLAEGSAILDVVDEVGYADQPHLTRALKRYIGQTPFQIVRKRQTE